MKNTGGANNEIKSRKSMPLITSSFSCFLKKKLWLFFVMHNIPYLQALTHTYGTVFFFGGDEHGLKILSQSSIVKAKNESLSNSINYIL